VAGVLRSSRAVIDHPDRVDSLGILNTFYAAVPRMRLPELIEVFATAAYENRKFRPLLTAFAPPATSSLACNFLQTGK
jgi:hypothetical protein